MVKLYYFFMIGHFSVWTLLLLKLHIILLVSALDLRGGNILLFDICIYQDCTEHLLRAGMPTEGTQ